MEGRERTESGGKMRARLLRKGKNEVDRREGRGRGREEEGICRTNVKVLPTPLSYTAACDHGALRLNELLKLRVD